MKLETDFFKALLASFLAALNTAFRSLTDYLKDFQTNRHVCSTTLKSIGFMPPSINPETNAADFRSFKMNQAIIF